MHIGKNIRIEANSLLPINSTQVKELKKQLNKHSAKSIISINVSILKSMIRRIELDNE